MQGHERRVFMGLNHTLHTWRPVLYYEHDWPFDNIAHGKNNGMPQAPMRWLARHSGYTCVPAPPPPRGGA